MSFLICLFITLISGYHAYPQYRYQQTQSSFLSSLRSHQLVQLQSRHLPSAHTSALASRFWTSSKPQPFRVNAHKYTTESMTDIRTSYEHPKYQEIEMNIDGMKVMINLHRDDEIFGPNYSETESVYHDGIRQPHLEITRDTERCYYRGNINNQQTPFLTMHTCYQGYSGMFTLGNDMFLIEPAHRHMDTHSFNQHLQTLDADVNPFSLHIIARADEVITPKFVCGVGMEGLSSQQRTEHMIEQLTTASEYGSGTLAQAIKHMMSEIKPVHSQSRSFQTRDAVNQKYIELLVVNDNKRVTLYGGSTPAVATSTVAIVQLVNQYYINQKFNPPIKVVLIGQLFFTVQDPYTVQFGNCATCAPGEVDVTQLLSLFNTWRSDPAHTTPYTNFDCGQLYSGLKFDGPVLGYAGVRAMCKPVQSGGICQMTNADAFNAIISAHEMGHNLGMEHDSGSPANCPTTGFIMTAIVDFGSPPSQFSPCSMTYLNSYVSDQYSPQTCMDNVPTSQWGSAICGNGFVEAGEDCDCGSHYCFNTTNPCCNGATCKFNANATCSATSPCCNNCQIRSKTENYVCRASATSCDIQEICDGVKETCPADYGLGAGTSCQEKGYPNGMCYGGVCQSQLRACRETGSTFPGAPYDQCPQQASLNTDGNFCGTMYCANNPSYCTFFHVAGQIALIPDGVPCDTNSQCLHQQCVSSNSLNTQFTWQSTDWTDCQSCNQIQTRNVTCVTTDTHQQYDDEYCTPSAKPTSSQQCINYEIGCTPQDDSTATGDLNIFGYVIAKNTILFVSLGAVSLFLICLGICYQAVTHGTIDEYVRPKSYDEPLSPGSINK